MDSVNTTSAPPLVPHAVRRGAGGLASAGTLVVLREHDVCIAIKENVVMGVWRSAATIERLQSVRRCIERITVDSPVKAVVFVVVHRNAPLPELAARGEAVRMMRDLGDRIGGWVLVLEGDSMWRSALRTVASTVKLLARASFPMHVCASTAEGVAWLMTQHRSGQLTGPSPEHLNSTLAELR